MPWVISPVSGRRIEVGGLAYDRLSPQQKKNLAPIGSAKLKSRNQNSQKSPPKKKMTSSKPATVVPSSIYLLIYSSPNLNEETVILAKTSSHHSMQKVMRRIAKTQGLGGILLTSDALIYEEIMIETYDIQYTTFDQVMADPYSYGHWEEDSLWAIVNRDFSKITTERLEMLMKKMDLPELELSLGRQHELMDTYLQDVNYTLGRDNSGKLVPVVNVKNLPNGKIVGESPNGGMIAATWSRPKSK